MNPSEPDLRAVLRAHLTRAIKHRDALAAGALRSTLGAIDNAEALSAQEATPTVGDGPIAGAAGTAGAGGTGGGGGGGGGGGAVGSIVIVTAIATPACSARSWSWPAAAAGPGRSRPTTTSAPSSCCSRCRTTRRCGCSATPSSPRSRTAKAPTAAS